MESGEALHGLQGVQGRAPGLQVIRDVHVSNTHCSHYSIHPADRSVEVPEVAVKQCLQSLTAPA